MDGARTIQRLLNHAWAYELLQVAVGSNRSHARFVEEYVRPRPGERVLDIGCGPAHILRALPARVTYVGIDTDEDYVSAARRNWGDRGEFHVADGSADLALDGAFDVVLLMGVLHHLNDDECAQAFTNAAYALAASGRVVSIDPTWLPDATTAANWLISRDRGAHVRSPYGYAGLAQDVFRTVAIETRSDLLRVPYAHAVLTCTDPASRP